ncbi:hypothetical protein D3C78_962370 [compost metagenome]
MSAAFHLLRHQLAHHRQLQQVLLEGVDAGFAVEQAVEVLGQALPAGGEVVGVAGLGQAVEQRLHQPGVGAFGVGLAGFQSVAQGHQLVDFGDDTVLFGEGWQRKGTCTKLGHVDRREVRRLL